ncbi:MAG: proteasome ATPase [Acidimicrobiia bacterium]|nr:proteasome ATPase [Acidimicrobiia bacterium]MBT8217217.1 proteasome ATPase [Acidimicrobiia bacterium]NNF10220.1 proteasome ATPase [Acidimicrobiia bacterium]NNL69292.1 proteasome ATPase [Acidimicrobiia bacterium]
MSSYESPEANELRNTIATLEEELSVLRRRLQDSPRRVRVLEERLLEAKGQLTQAVHQNEKLAAVLEETREQLAILREEVEKLTAPPNPFGTVLGINEDGTADVMTGGRKLRVNVEPTLEIKELERGQEVLLNEAYNVIDVRDFDPQGEVVAVKEVVDEHRLIVLGRGDEERVIERAAPLVSEFLRVGDHVRLDTRTGLAFEKLLRPEIEELVLEEVPDTTYEQVGGLREQIESIRDAVELPYLYKERFNDYQLKAPKGILLYGPPGCGKTLIAKAVANSLAKAVSEKTGSDDSRSYFLNIKGPELLNKYVGETERQIRVIFQRAKEKSDEGVPVIVFFDEMDSLFRTRGTGVSSDVESTIVPQLLSELDGVEALKNVIVIGASNREDLIDPAILRPGRLDVKIKIERPGPEAAAQIFGIYLLPDLPLDEEELGRHGGDKQALIEAMIRSTVDRVFDSSDANRFLEVTYANGDKELLYFKDFLSGAMIENIVRRAKKEAIKREIADGTIGIKTTDLLDAIVQEFREHEDLPNTTNPDDWARISGKKGERIVYVRTLIEGDKENRTIEATTTGQYL